MTKTNENETKLFDMMESMISDDVETVIEWILINAEEQLENVKAKMADKLELRRLEKELAEAKKELRIERTQRTKERNKLEKQIEELKGSPPSQPAPKKEPEAEPEPPKPKPAAKKADSKPKDAAPKQTKRVKKTAVSKAKETEEEIPDSRTIDEVSADEIAKVRKWGETMTAERIRTSLQNPHLIPWHRTIAEEILAAKLKEEATTETTTESPAKPVPPQDNLSENAVAIKKILSNNTIETFDSVVEAAGAMNISELDAYNAIDELENKGQIKFPETGKLQIVN